ncbi:GntR family transcriptional regulator [Bradyrhizobium sp. LHD-71]|uniref:GntR family transcriptional regulator n=1 Tax=Bradyrhizobium sp. LHD-71 TaxID=3072141 RepID=UPI00280FDC85|nr:GntR family transcriptional regulator [Bradyrhizobium sp. LHD-71]MDQ8727130.1 GntR family transcriptional regulator [Bradyrhizobium sp. LHD-71]
MTETAYGELKRKILRSELAPGAHFLEEELAVMLGMSRTPVREAAVRLEQEGFLEIVPRRGFRVTRLSKRTVREINEVLECLEIQAAERLAARRIAADDLKLLEDAVARMDVALESEDAQAWAQADYEFHTLLIVLCGNQHLAEVAKNFLDKAHRFRLMTLQLRAKPVYSNVNHAAVVEAVRRNDPQTAQDIHRAHKRRWARELSDLLERLDLPE